MPRVEKINTLKSSVKKMLIKSPASRDSDDKLVCNIWHGLLKEKIKDMTAIELLKVISEGVLPSYDNISRARRKIQEENASLRGDNYKERHNEETDVRHKINK